MTEKLNRPKVDQIGVIVKDLNKSVEHYTSLGIGPFQTLTGIESRERMMRGKPILLLKHINCSVLHGRITLMLSQIWI